MTPAKAAATSTVNNCLICGGDRLANGGNVQLRGGAKVCHACLRNKVDPKRAARWPSRDDILEKRRREYREAVEQRDGVRRECEKILKELMDKARSKVHAEVRRMSFWSRLSLLFNPFGKGPADEH